jgi:hypothetical protein
VAASKVRMVLLLWRARLARMKGKLSQRATVPLELEHLRREILTLAGT